MKLEEKLNLEIVIDSKKTRKQLDEISKCFNKATLAMAKLNSEIDKLKNTEIELKVVEFKTKWWHRLNPFK